MHLCTDIAQNFIPEPLHCSTGENGCSAINFTFVDPEVLFFSAHFDLEMTSLVVASRAGLDIALLLIRWAVTNMLLSYHSPNMENTAERR